MRRTREAARPAAEGPSRHSRLVDGAGDGADGAGDGFAWNDGLGDGDGLTPYCRDIVRVIKRA